MLTPMRIPFGFAKEAESSDVALAKRIRAFDQSAAKELTTKLAPSLQSALNSFRASAIAQPILEIEAKRLAVEAARNWDMTTGTLGGYVTTKVKQGLYDYAVRHQNVASIPREHADRIGGYREAVDTLVDMHGRDPTALEVAEHMGIPLKKVDMLARVSRKVVPESATTFEDLEDSADHERVRLAYYGFTDQEKLVFDYSLGAHGKTKMSNNEIAAKLGVSAARVSTLKSNIADKIAPYVRG